MTKSFDEWFKGAMPNTHKGVGSEKIETFVYETAQDAWNFKQAEIDELQKRIDGALKHMSECQLGLEDVYQIIEDYLKPSEPPKGNTNEH